MALKTLERPIRMTALTRMLAGELPDILGQIQTSCRALFQQEQNAEFRRGLRSLVRTLAETAECHGFVGIVRAGRGLEVALDDGAPESVGAALAWLTEEVGVVRDSVSAR